MTKLNRHYLFLLIVFGLIGPLLPTLPLWLTAPFLHINIPYFGVLDGVEIKKEVLPFAYKVGTLPALLTGALIWALRLRRNCKGLVATFGLGWLLGCLALTIFPQETFPFSDGMGSRESGGIAQLILASLFCFGGFSAYLLSFTLPLPADKAIDPAREGHYFLLFLALPLLGPILGMLPFYIEISLTTAHIPSGWGLKNLLGWAYLLGMAPAALLGRQVWALQLCRNWAGCLKMVLLGLLMMAWPGLIFSIFNGDISSALRLGAYGAFSALCFCPFLPRPAAASPSSNSSPEKNHD